MFFVPFIKSYLILQVFLWYLDHITLDSISASLVSNLLSNQLLEDEEQQLIVVLAKCQVASECLQRHIDSNNLMLTWNEKEPETSVKVLLCLKSTTQTHLPHAPHYTELLCVDEALQHDPDGHIDIILQYVVPQVHFGMSLGHADHGLYVTNSDGNATRGLLTNMVAFSLVGHLSCTFPYF